MSLEFRWAGQEDLDRVALCRARCFGHGPDVLERCGRVLRADGRARAEDILLAEEDAQPVGTAAALSMTMWVRGAPLPVQGVAWVGTVKTFRRSAGHGRGPGVASQIMHRTLARARECGQALSALMPWRASFYEHFGYGLVERRHEWTIPIALLPSGPADGWEFVSEARALMEARQRMVEAGQCDIERPAGAWGRCLIDWESGFVVGDRSAGGSIRSWMFLRHEPRNGRDCIRVVDWARCGAEDLLRQLHFLATFRDQYHSAVIIVPADVPLNAVLREHQIPHRLVNHETSEARPYTRMQVRVLDHCRLIGAMKTLPEHVRGAATVAVRETEGNTSIFRIELDGGRAWARAVAGEADLECTDRAWAPIVLGDLSATASARLGLVTIRNPAALPILDAFSAGPLPFCNEYF